MRIRVFLEVEVDETVLMTAVQQQVPEAVVEELPKYVANSTQGFLMSALPGVVHCGACVVPNLEPKTHIIQPGRKGLSLVDKL